MRLRNILIVVEDIEKSKKFYHDLFGLDVILDNEENVILTEGLVLQEKTIWKNFLERDIISESNSCELYFEAHKGTVGRCSYGLRTEDSRPRLWLPGPSDRSVRCRTPSGTVPLRGRRACLASSLPPG